MNIKTKKCKECKKEYRAYYRDGILISRLCKSCRIKKQIEKKEKHKLTKTYKKKTIKKLHGKAWKLMSEWVRRKDADDNEMVLCYTCGKYSYWRDLHAGHFMHGHLDFDERNIKPQCNKCNTFLNGNLGIYAINIMNDNSPEYLEKLKLDAWTEKRLDIPDLERIIKDLKDKIRKLDD